MIIPFFIHKRGLHGKPLSIYSNMYNFTPSTSEVNSKI
uniref:Uncharacterized protein n=1 Tax=Arundo donax TaxID=35708 RepID=A0A0A9E5T2_ARUDO